MRSKIIKGIFILAVAVISAATAFSCHKGFTPVDTPEKKDKQASELNILVCGNSMLYYGGIVQNGSQRSSDQGMLYKMLSSDGVKPKIIDCTYGGHHLKDFTASGCIWAEKHGSDGKTASGGCAGLGFDLLGGLDLKAFDYIIISEAGNNYSSFYDDAVALFKRVRDVNPAVKMIYVNHIYSVYKGHTNVLDKLKTLHDSLGVTIVNCGQLAYDIYKGNVKVPGGTLSYSDRYTFCNHTESDTYHPNPLMGYIMTQMTVCAIIGKKAEGTDYMSFVRDCCYAGGKVSFDEYYSKYYTTPASLPFTAVLGNPTEIKGVQELIPYYINKY